MYFAAILCLGIAAFFVIFLMDDTGVAILKSKYFFIY
jgi:hypothetical protein